MQTLKQFLVAEKQAGKVIFPAGNQIFNALDSTPFEAVKVVILGQDPYHGPGQAHGLSFSVPLGVKIPPSLRNIYKEIERDLGFKELGLSMPSHGCLQSWAQQGVLLLNATLTVEQAQAGSHQRRGWELFTDKIVQTLSEQRSGLVFLLWGSYAQKKGRVIDRSKHCVLEAVHPSPLSAHRGFLGCGHFSQANHYLQQQGLAPIDWSLPAMV
jgi:uracil-DNA glycosylase